MPSQADIAPALTFAVTIRAKGFTQLLPAGGCAASEVGGAVVQAVDLVERAMADCPAGLALAVVHGTGTGRVRQAVHTMLRGAPQARLPPPDPALVIWGEQPQYCHA